MADSVAGAGPRPRPPAGPGTVGMLIQAAAMYFLFTSITGRGTKGTAHLPSTPPPPVDAAPAQLESAFLEAPGSLESGAPQPSAQAREPAPPGASSPSLFNLIGMPDPPKTTRRVPAELAYLEVARKARLAAVPGDARLRNIWPPGLSFDLYVFLSAQPTPLDDFPAIDGVWGQWSAGRTHADVPFLTVADGGAVEVTEAGSSGSNDKGTSFTLLGGVFKRAIDRLAAKGTVTRLPNATFDALVQEGVPSNQSALLWARHGLAYDWSPGTIEQHVNVSIPASVLANESSLFAHVFAVAGGGHPSPSHPRYAGQWSVLHTVYPLVTHLKRKPVKVTYNLLGDKAGALSTATDTPAPTPAATNETRILPYWRPSLFVSLLIDSSVHAAKGLPPPLDSVLHVVPDARTAHMAGGGTAYTPPLIVDDFWLLQSSLLPLNTSRPDGAVVPLLVSFSGTSLWKWAMASQMQSQWAMQEQMGAAGEGEADVLKSIIMDTNPVLLAVTALVSLLHMVFEFLAFRNDVSFWRGVKSTAGLSVRSIGMSFVTQLIILLYLADNDTSWMVLFSSVIGLAIEGWKLRKALVVNFTWAPAPSWMHAPGLNLPWVDISDKEVDEATTTTRKYDDIATRHMLVCLVPLVIGQSMYSLVYETHRSWYSWLIGSLTSFTYTFGFVSMTPQLYINYRLKSVAAMPWKTMMYKFLNTIVDDIFSFVIKMPTMHRLACFRDDIIFVIYLVQRWLYPVDKARKNEFGASAYDYENAEARRKGLKRVLRRGKLERRTGPSGEEAHHDD